MEVQGVEGPEGVVDDEGDEEVYDGCGFIGEFHFGGGNCQGIFW